MSDDQSARGQDRRGAKRFETPEMEGTLGGKSGDLKCRISNLSRLGACAISNIALPEMTRVRVRFSIDEPEGAARAINCEAAVVRCQKRPDGLFEVGLFFTTMQPADRAAIGSLADRGAPVTAR
jgi:hypothetical protein